MQSNSQTYRIRIYSISARIHGIKCHWMESFRCMNCHNNKLICEIANTRKLNAKYCDVWLFIMFSVLSHFILLYFVYALAFSCVCGVSMVVVSLCAPLLLHIHFNHFRFLPIFLHSLICWFIALFCLFHTSY